MAIKIKSWHIRGLYNCALGLHEKANTKAKFSFEQEEVHVRNCLISEKLSNIFHRRTDLVLKGTENFLLIDKVSRELEKINLIHYLTAFDQVLSIGKFITKKIKFQNANYELNEKFDMIVKSVDPSNQKEYISVYNFMMGQASVTQTTTIKDTVQAILINEKYGDIPIRIYRVNLSTSDTYYDEFSIKRVKSFLEFIKPALGQVHNIIKNGPGTMSTCGECESCLKQDLIITKTGDLVDQYEKLKSESTMIKSLMKKFCNENEIDIKGKNKTYGLSTNKSVRF